MFSLFISKQLIHKIKFITRYGDRYNKSLTTVAGRELSCTHSLTTTSVIVNSIANFYAWLSRKPSITIQTHSRFISSYHKQLQYYSKSRLIAKCRKSYSNLKSLFFERPAKLNLRNE